MKRIALVGQSALVLRQLDRHLRKHPGFSTAGALDVSRPVGPALQEMAPDVVLIDDQGGERVAAAVAEAAAATSGAMIVVLTSSQEPEWVDRLIASGATTLLSRKVHPALITALLRQLVMGSIMHATRPRPRPETAPFGPLTAREMQILRFVAEGRRNQQIANELTVTPQTVKFHLSNIYRKLEVTSRTEASRYAYTHGLLSVGSPGSIAAA